MSDIDTITIPDSPEAMQEFLMDKTKRSQVFSATADPKDLVKFMTAYANVTAKKDGDLETQIKDQTERFLADWAREHKMDLRKGGPDGAKATAADIRAQRALGTKHSKIAVGSKLDGKFEDSWEFLETIHHKQDPRDPKVAEKRALIEAAMSSTDPASGGFLIPEEFRTTLMGVALESAVVRPRARVIPMQSLRISMPVVDATSNVSSVYGGVVGYWTEEAAALVQSQPAFARIALEAKKLTAYTEVPNELRRDSPISIDTYLNEIFPAAISWFEDLAFMFGTGVGEPLGLFNSLNSAMITAAAEGGQPASTIVWENLVGMYARMLPSSLASAVWVVSPATFPQLMTTALSVGTGGAPIGMAMNNGTPVLSLLGRPVIISEKVGNLGAAGDVNFVDFGQYLIGDRMQMEAEVSPHYKFGNDMTAYRFIERVDGRPWMQSAITPRNGGPTLSPYVQLAARP